MCFRSPHLKLQLLVSKVRCQNQERTCRENVFGPNVVDWQADSSKGVELRKNRIEVERVK